MSVVLEETINVWQKLHWQCRNMVPSPRGKASTTHRLERLAAAVRAIKHPAGLSFAATEVVSKVIGFLALQKQTSLPVCVWPSEMERHKETKSTTMWRFLLIEKSLFPLRWEHSFTSKIVCLLVGFSLIFTCCLFCYTDKKGHKSKIKSITGADVAVLLLSFS